MDRLLAIPLNWKPFPGPQTAALTSAADIIFYGGAAGGGKTDLLLGAAHSVHWRSIIYRREYKQLEQIEDRAREMFGHLGGFQSSAHRWLILQGKNAGARVSFAAVQFENDKKKFQGRPYDFIGFDEITHFTETQFRFLMGWNRTAKKGQRVRVVCAGNPPTDAEGEWVIRFWAPWLDPTHPNPAKPGELRYFATIAGKDIERPNGEPFEHVEDGETEIITPKSRTFIPARVEDNPVYMATGYRAQLQALPEPLRSLFLKGAFDGVTEDHPWQVIPTKWIRAAQERWLRMEKPKTPLSAIGADIARGGRDRTIFTPRFDSYFGEQKIYQGIETPDGDAVVAKLFPLVDNPLAIVNIDVIGIGSSAYDTAKKHFRCNPINSAEASIRRDRTQQLGFANLRAEMLWMLREDLDPEHGATLAIPPDRELLSDLVSYRWLMKGGKIAIEKKEDMMERIGRSPDKGDSLIYAHANPYKAGTGLFDWYAEEAARVIAARAAQQNGAANGTA